MKSVSRDTIVGAGTIGLGFLFLYLARTIDTDPDDPYGPMLVPTIIAALIIGFGLLQMTAGLFNKQPGDSPVEEPGKPVNLAQLAILTALGFVYVLLFSLIGYLLSTLIVLAALLLAFGNRLNWRFVSITVIGAIIYHIAFIELMGVHDPGALMNFDARALFGL